LSHRDLEYETVDYTGGFPMAQIVVKDLGESAELDREAMRAIVGGKAGPRLGGPAQHYGRFENPLSFSTLRLLPDAVKSGLNH
jgi:hypothetical protein